MNRVSVIIPTQNRPKELWRCLQPLMQCRFIDEIIIMDNSDLRDVPSSIRLNDKYIQIVYTPVHNVSKLRSLGAYLARNQYVLLLDDSNEFEYSATNEDQIESAIQDITKGFPFVSFPVRNAKPHDSQDSDDWTDRLFAREEFIDFENQKVNWYQFYNDAFTIPTYHFCGGGVLLERSVAERIFEQASLVFKEGDRGEDAWAAMTLCKERGVYGLFNPSIRIHHHPGEYREWEDRGKVKELDEIEAEVKPLYFEYMKGLQTHGV